MRSEINRIKQPGGWYGDCISLKSGLKEGWIDIRPRFNPKILFEKLILLSSNYTPII
jgi:hypothetical protein